MNRRSNDSRLVCLSPTILVAFLTVCAVTATPGCGSSTRSTTEQKLPGGEDLGPADLAAEAQGYAETLRLKLKPDHQSALSSLQFTATEKGGHRQCLITGTASSAVRQEVESILHQYYPQLQIVWR